MVLAIDTMPAGWQAFFYVLACVSFLSAALLVVLTERDVAVSVGLIGVGLFCAAFVLAWNAVAAA